MNTDAQGVPPMSYVEKKGRIAAFAKYKSQGTNLSV